MNVIRTCAINLSSSTMNYAQISSHSEFCCRKNIIIDSYKGGWRGVKKLTIKRENSRTFSQPQVLHSNEFAKNNQGPPDIQLLFVCEYWTTKFQ